MAINIPNWLNPFYTRNKSGDSIYMFSGNNEWTANTNNLYIAQNHPILTPALLFVSKLFSQARFHVEEVGTGKRVEHKILDLLIKENRTKDLQGNSNTIQCAKSVLNHIK